MIDAIAACPSCDHVLRWLSGATWPDDRWRYLNEWHAKGLALRTVPHDTATGLPKGHSIACPRRPAPLPTEFF